VLAETVEDQLEKSSEGQENQDGGQQTENKRMNFNIDDMLILQSCFDGKPLQTCLVYIMLIDLFACLELFLVYIMLIILFEYIMICCFLAKLFQPFITFSPLFSFHAQSDLGCLLLCLQ